MDSPFRGVGLLLFLAVLKVSLFLPLTASAQGGASGGFGATSLDERVLLSVYELEAPAVRGTVHLLDRSAYPVFFLVPTAAWAHAWMAGSERYTTAYQLSMSAALTYATVKGTKALIHRERPFLAVPGIEARREGGADRRFDSFPSGHAAMAFAIATTLAQAYPNWTVAVPVYTWATALALSRVWLGMHYPSDALVGALTGVGLSVLVRQVGDAVTVPLFLGPVDGGMQLGVRIALP